MTTEQQTDDLPPNVTIEEIEFKYSGNKLAGSLSLPSVVHAGVVLLHGSGPVDLTNNGYFPLIRNAFTEHGIAVLCYDKPGIGESEGDWRTQSLRDRAYEAVIALEHLGRDDRINTQRIGLWGISQGGWVAQLAASLSSLPAFIITVSGPGVSPAKQNIYDTVTSLRQGGSSPEDIERGREWTESLMDAARRQVSFDEIERTVLRAAQNEPWGEYWDISDERSWNFFTTRDSVTGRPNIDYDPEPVLMQVRCPVLGIFGDRDALVPVKESVEVYERALDTTGDRQSSVEVFSDADHGIRIEGTSEFPSNYMKLMTDWILGLDV